MREVVKTGRFTQPLSVRTTSPGASPRGSSGSTASRPLRERYGPCRERTKRQPRRGTPRESRASRRLRYCPGMSTPATFLVLVTGHAAAGKSTVAPQLAEELGGVWISRDAIHSKIYSGWRPAHPALSSPQYDPQIGDNVYYEGSVVWDVFLWMLGTVTPHYPVVADTPFNHPWNRKMFNDAAASWTFPMVEVALEGDPVTLLARARKRAQQPGVHEIKARFSVRPEKYEHPYQPVLDEQHVVRVDSTDLNVVDPAAIAADVRARLRISPGPEVLTQRP